MAEGGYDPKYSSVNGMSRPVCRFYLRNGCTKGDKCAFRHTRIGPTESDAFRDTRSGPTESDVVCKYYQVGQCGFGSNCKFSHGKTVKHKDSPHGQMTNQTFENGQVSKFAAKEFPSHMVTLKKSNYGKGVQESESARTKKEFEQKWVAAQDFVPGKKFHGPVPSTYANAVQPNKDSSLAADDESDLSSLVSENYLLCPYFEQSGHCPFESTCQYAHGFMCDFCGLPKLHPLDEVQRDKHVKECIAEHEKQMEHAFAVQASQEKECGICLENVLEKENSHASASSKRFGILENCNHCFCLSCIRTWRHNKSDVIQTQRTCPTCRTHSDFVTPSKFWVESPEEKKKLIEDYKKAMSTKACQYFKLGKGECPFNNRCFYQHALEDGSIVHENIVRRRRRLNADGERGLEEDYSLWDYITRREEDGLLPLDAQLSLVLLGIFQDSDDDDDNNNSFGLRYDFLNGDFIFTDSDLETDSD